MPYYSDLLKFRPAISTVLTAASEFSKLQKFINFRGKKLDVTINLARLTGWGFFARICGNMA